MTDYVPDISVDDVIDALVTYLRPFVLDAEIVRGQVNRVAQPLPPCVVLTELLQVNLSRPRIDNSSDIDVLATTITGPTRIDIQIDFYGDDAGNFCKAFESAWGCAYGFVDFPANIKPLYATDGMQMPMVTGEQQYQSRWTVTASLQYNPAVTLPQQSAIDADVIIDYPVDLT